MICKNLTVGTRIDSGSEEEISTLCSSLKSTLAYSLAERLARNAHRTIPLAASLFAIPKSRQSTVKVTAVKEEAKMMEDVKKFRSELLSTSSSSEDSKKHRKLLECLHQFEQALLAHGNLESKQVEMLDRAAKFLLAECLKAEYEEIFKYTHLESIVCNLTVTAAGMVGISLKLVICILEKLFEKDLKLSKIRKSKGYELMKKTSIKLWDVY
jgi:hypothetical protein